MSDSDLEKTMRSEDVEPEMAVNQHDGTVAVEEKGRTVVLTDKETIVIEKPMEIDIIPSNRPRKVYKGMWGPAEIGALAAASLVVLATLGVVFFGTLPAKRELERNKAARDRLETELAAAREKYGSIKDTQTQAATLVQSANDFETRYLPIASIGQSALYQRLNGLIAAYGLVNTSGPDYSPLEIADQGSNNQTDEERGRAKFRSLFPGAYVTMTLEGSYQNLRRFIRDIETGNDFVIISAVELEPSDTQQIEKKTAAQPEDSGVDIYGGIPVMPGERSAAQNEPRKGRTIGGIVNLRLEMAAYFRRPNAVPPPAATVQQQ